MPNNILRIIADSPELYEAVEFLLYKNAVKSKLEGSAMVELTLQEIAKYRTIEKKEGIMNPAR